MKKKKSLFNAVIAAFILTIVGLSFLGLNQSAKAQNSTDPNTPTEAPSVTPTDRTRNTQNYEERLKEAEQKAEERRNEIIANRCERVTARVQDRREVYSARADLIRQRHENVKIAVADLVASFKVREYDTSALEASLVEFDQILVDFNSSHSGVLAELVKTGELACAENKEQYNQNVELVNNYVKEVQADILEMRTFVQEVIIPEMQNLREQVQANQNN